jgi:hypothetical protein
MDDFLLDCCFNAIYEGLKFRKSILRYANRLRAMPHSAESRLPAMLHSAESTQIRDISVKSKANAKIF